MEWWHGLDWSGTGPRQAVMIALMNIRVYKMRRISWLDEDMLASQDDLCSSNLKETLRNYRSYTKEHDNFKISILKKCAICFIFVSFVCHIYCYIIKLLSGIFLDIYGLNLVQSAMSLKPLWEDEEFHFLHPHGGNIKMCLQGYVCQWPVTALLLHQTLFGCYRTYLISWRGNCVSREMRCLGYATFWTALNNRSCFNWTTLLRNLRNAWLLLGFWTAYYSNHFISDRLYVSFLSW
jgi:hypothetical protein